MGSWCMGACASLQGCMCMDACMHEKHQLGVIECIISNKIKIRKDKELLGRETTNIPPNPSHVE